uniref:RanBP2-type domain-containing protein n=1 Tax=Megaselia scalaris TaxID=36166 RepID=T1GR29_MEGSC
TSTRKPRLNSALVAQQAATLPGVSGVPNGTTNKPSSAASTSKNANRHRNKHKKCPARLKNVDRSTARTLEVAKMDHKKSPIRRQKRKMDKVEENLWDCSVCTFRNTAEAFKCLMCDVRK